MTRVLFACWPFEGHVFPQVSMAIGLRERGLQVAFYTDESRRALIEAEGFEVFPFRRVGPAWLRVQGSEGSTADRGHRARQIRAAREWIIGTIPDQVDDLQDVVRDWRPDVLGAEASMWGPLLVLSEVLPIPVALVSPLIGAGVPGPDAPAPGVVAPPHSVRAQILKAIATHLTALVTRPMRRRIDGYRREHGLAPMGDSVNGFFARLPLYLVLSVPELDFERRDLPTSVHYVGPCLWHPPEPPGTSEWLSRLSHQRPWVHVTEGTSHFKDPFILRAAVEGLSGRPYEAILTTGRGRDVAAMGLEGPAGNVHVRPWLSHDVLLPRCSAIVTTGGMGTVMAALRAGVPLVVVPTSWDQPGSAQRVVAARVGVRLAPRRCSPDRLREAVECVLDDPGYRANAQRAAERLAAAPGPRGAAELIVRLAEAGRATSSPPALARSVP
jgi:MGT family glycosyltransferase